MKQNDTPPPRYLTTQDLIFRWKVTSATIRRWRKAGRLKVAFIGRGVRFAVSEIERFEREAEA